MNIEEIMMEHSWICVFGMIFGEQAIMFEGTMCCIIRTREFCAGGVEVWDCKFLNNIRRNNLRL